MRCDCGGICQIEQRDMELNKVTVKDVRVSACVACGSTYVRGMEITRVIKKYEQAVLDKKLEDLEKDRGLSF